MNIITVLVLILAIPILLLLGTYPGHHPIRTALLTCKVFLALSSCLGNRLRTQDSSRNPRNGHYGQTYFRTMTNSGPAMTEHIEMETMLNDREDFETDSR